MVPPGWPHLVVFDLAGTTVEDRGQVPEAFTAALLAAGVQVSAEQVRQVRGASKRQALRELLPPGAEPSGQVERVYAGFITHLKGRFNTEGVHEIPGTAEVFRQLRGLGIRVVLNTGFDREITGYLLDGLGWRVGIVDGVACGDDVARGRPAPDLILRAMQITGVEDAHWVANVGDTTLDLRAGQAAGVGWNIGVLSGAHERTMLESAPHTHLITSVADLPDCWSLGG
jgi:phosphonatase-like hydrolase